MGITEFQTGNAPRVFPVDVEHAGIRLVLPILIVGSGIFFYVVFSPLIGSIVESALGFDALNGIFGFGIALLGALVVGALSDRLLKRVWSSGRTLTLDQDALNLVDRRRGHNTQTRLEFGSRINVQSWRFTVRRSSPRAPSGWQMLACQLAQDDTELILYTFMPPKNASAFGLARFFSELAGRKDLEGGKLSLREMTEQRRLLKAENERWEDGAELQPDSFASVLSVLALHIPEWQA